MTKDQKDLIKQCENIFEQTAKFFCKKYFNTDDYYWIGNEKGGCIEVCDMFFTFEDILYYLKNGYTFNKMCDRYYSIVNSTK